MSIEVIDKNAKIIWDYMNMHQDLKKAGAIIALGTNDLRVADRAAQIWKEGFAPIIITTGGIAHEKDLLDTGWDKSEAEVYKDRLLSLDVPEEVILVEREAKNTGENVSKVKTLLESKGLNISDFIIVTKPWFERRAYATFLKNWPGVNIIMASPLDSYEEYMSEAREMQLNIMVGDFQRIKIYAEKGHQIPQEIPERVWEAYKELVALGYDKHLVKA